MLGAGFRLPGGGSVLVSVADKDKEEVAPIVAEYARLGFKIFATEDTAAFLQEREIKVDTVINGDNCEPVDLIRNGEIQLIINTPTKGKVPGRLGFKIRRAASEYRVPCLTSLDTAQAIISIIKFLQQGDIPQAVALKEFTAHIVR